MSPVGTGKPEIHGNRHRIVEEHSRIKELVREVEQTRDLPALMSLVTQLQAVLKPHFELEEGQGGLQDIVGARAPQNYSAIEHLIAEHRTLLVEAHEFVEAAHRCLEGPVADVIHRARALCEQLRAHEARESDLLIDSVYTDLGGGA